MTQLATLRLPAGAGVRRRGARSRAVHAARGDQRRHADPHRIAAPGQGRGAGGRGHGHRPGRRPRGPDGHPGPGAGADRAPTRRAGLGALALPDLLRVDELRDRHPLDHPQSLHHLCHRPGRDRVHGLSLLHRRDQLGGQLAALGCDPVERHQRAGARSQGPGPEPSAGRRPGDLPPRPHDPAIAATRPTPCGSSIGCDSSPSCPRAFAWPPGPSSRWRRASGWRSRSGGGIRARPPRRRPRITGARTWRPIATRRSPTSPTSISTSSSSPRPAAIGRRGPMTWSTPRTSRSARSP